MTDVPGGIPLDPRHYEELSVGSGIDHGIIVARGYRTVNDSKELLDLGFSKEQAALVPGYLLPMFGIDGPGAGYQFKPDNPRLNKKGKPIKYETPAGWKMRLDLGPFGNVWKDDPKEPLWVTEGIKKGDSAASRGLRVLTLIGVWNWRGSNEKGGSVELADWEGIALKGRHVFLCFDSDVMQKPPVQMALRRLAGFLRRRGAHVVCILPPDDPAHPGKTGMDDFFVRGGKTQELRKSEAPWLLDAREVVVTNRSIGEISFDGLSAIVDNNIPPTTFVRAGELVRIVHDERGIAKIQGYNTSTLRGLLGRAIAWVKPIKKKDDVANVEVFPPREVVEDVLTLGSWPGIPPLQAITKAPVLAPDFTLSESPGYDPASGFFVFSKKAWPKWEGDLASAVAFVKDVLVDFPFAGEADFAHAFALMILPILRPAIKGPTPLHLIDAPVQGTGKSLLAKVCLMPTMGDQISATPGTRDEEEWRKKIASGLLEGRAYMFLDNLSRKVDSDSLAGALTSTEWNDRALSTMQNINVPITLVWVATANNVELSRDILRRVIWSRLDAQLERPEDRGGFVHPDIVKYVSENRERIVSAMCFIVQSWIAAGCPRFSGRRLGSFEAYSSIVGGVLEHAGIPGFLGNLEELRSHADSQEGAWAAFYHKWRADYGFQPLKAANLMSTFEADDELAGLLGDAKNESAKKIRLGFLLRKRVGVISGGYRVERAESDTHANQNLYRIVEVARKPQLPPTSAPTSAPVFEPNSSSVAEVAEVAEVIGTLRTCAQARADESAVELPQLPPTPANKLPPPAPGKRRIEL